MGVLRLYVKEDKDEVLRLINRYLGRDCKDDDLGLYSHACEVLQRIIFNYDEYKEECVVFKSDGVFIIGLKDSHYELEVRLELCHKNVENIHYNVSEVVIRDAESLTQTTIQDSDGYIKVESILESKEVV